MQENTEPAGEIRFFGIGRDARIAAMDRPGKSGGHYVCELCLILADSSAL